MFSSNTDCSGNSSETSMFSSNTDCSGDSSSMSTEKPQLKALTGCEVSLGGSLTSRRGCLTGDLERSGVSGHGVLDQDGNSSSDDDLIWSVSAGPLMISVTSSLLRPAASPKARELDMRYISFLRPCANTKSCWSLWKNMSLPVGQVLPDFEAITCCSERVQKLPADSHGARGDLPVACSSGTSWLLKCAPELVTRRSIGMTRFGPNTRITNGIRFFYSWVAGCELHSNSIWRMLVVGQASRLLAKSTTSMTV